MPSGPHSDDDLGRWSAFANELRSQNWLMVLDSEIIDSVNSLRELSWTWDRADNCRCSSCFAKGDQSIQTRYLYVETLTRDWPEPSHEQLMASRGMLRVLQEFSSQQKLHESFGLQHFVEYKASYPDVQWPGAYWYEGRPTTLLMRCAHYVNELARELARSAAAGVGAAVEELGKLGLRYEPNDPLTYVIEGFSEDCYCLGSRAKGLKYYVGTTNDPVRRHSQHGLGQGAKFTMRMTGRMQGRPPDEYRGESGWWSLKDHSEHGDRASEVSEGLFDRLDELTRTLKLCHLHGQRHVRGSVMATSGNDHSEPQRRLIEVLRREHKGLCFGCGRPKHGQCNDDDLLFASWYGRSIASAVFELAGGSDVISMMRGIPLSSDDNRALAPFGTHTERVCKLVKAVAEKMYQEGVLSLDAVTVKESRTVDAAGGEGGGGSGTTPAELYALIDNARQLRPKQEEALAELLAGATTMLVQLPTAYGKTSIALGCAIHEIVFRGGRAVVFVPTIALMNDLMKTMEQITLARLGHRDVFRIDGRLRKSEYYSVYGGEFDVSLLERQVKVKWRRWQGAAQDPSMRAYQARPGYAEGNLIFTTPDKWMSSDAAECDAFVKCFGESAREFGMLIMDEAHTFDSVLGGHTCHLLQRMDRLREERGSVRVVMNSATVPGADEFMRNLVGEQRAAQIRYVRAQESDSPLSFVPWMELVDSSAAWQADARRRMLLFHSGLIRPMDCAALLPAAVLQECGVRRVVYFVDSLNTAKASMRDFQSGRFAARAGWSRDAITVTPYHGDVPTGPRACAEHLFSKWVSAPHLHVIVATSALEMGVNLEGLDIVIVSGKKHCEVSSLLQRIGRTGRKDGCPGLVIIGSGDADEDVETEEGAKEALTMPDESILVVKTEAMRLHSELRELQNDKFLGGAPGDDAIRDLREQGELETTMFSEMSTRGMSSPKINVVRATPSGGIMRPHMGWTEDGEDGEDGPPAYEVPLVRLDAMRALELACPGSHCRSSFGGLLHCLNPRFKRALPRPNSLDWLFEVDSIPAFKLTAMDDKHYFHSEAVWDRIPSLVSAGDAQLGGMNVYMVWRYLEFKSIYDPKMRIVEQPPRGGGDAGYHFYARPSPDDLGVTGLEEPPQVRLRACGFRCSETIRLDGEEATVKKMEEHLRDRLQLPRGLLHALVHEDRLYVFELAGIGVAKAALDRRDDWLHDFPGLVAA